MTNKKFISELNKRLAAVGKERDRLRDLSDELGSLLDSCERGYGYLQDAIDALSEQV